MADESARDFDPDERSEEQAAAREAGQIGGRVPGMERIDPAQRAPLESGEGVSEGFELAEEDLIEHASHGDQQSARVPYHLRDDRAEETEEVDADTDRFLSSEAEDQER
jgi:hypothetical protein